MKLTNLHQIKLKTAGRKKKKTPEFRIRTEDSYDKKRKLDCVLITVIDLVNQREIFRVKTTKFEKIKDIIKREAKHYGTTITDIQDESTIDKKKKLLEEQR